MTETNHEVGEMGLAKILADIEARGYNANRLLDLVREGQSLQVGDAVVLGDLADLVALIKPSYKVVRVDLGSDTTTQGFASNINTSTGIGINVGDKFIWAEISDKLESVSLAFIVNLTNSDGENPELVEVCNTLRSWSNNPQRCMLFVYDSGQGGGQARFELLRNTIKIKKTLR